MDDTTIKILLDTDIGTDIDDAVCLAYLLANPQCHLLGITTVTGEAAKRASLASVLCKAAGREIPIYPGYQAPMIGEQRQAAAQQAAALLHWPHQTDFPQGKAIEFMRHTIHAHPGEVVLLAIGPLTNVGHLFAVDPEIPRLLKGFVMMGGLFDEKSYAASSPEWNTCGDPRATEIVYGSQVRLHRSLGINVTQQAILSEDEVKQKFKAALLQPVLDFGEIWFRNFYPSITFHDPLAAATIFDETLCTYQQGTVTIDREEKPGWTHFAPGSTQAPHQVAVSVDVPRYFEHFFRFF